jgi:hypothetical protein
MPGSDEKVFDLKPNHMRALIKKVFKSSSVDDARKAELLEVALGEDKSDIAKNVRLTCQASSSDPKVKEQIWTDLCDPASTYSVQERGSMMEGFWVAD